MISVSGRERKQAHQSLAQLMGWTRVSQSHMYPINNILLLSWWSKDPLWDGMRMVSWWLRPERQANHSTWHSVDCRVGLFLLNPINSKKEVREHNWIMCRYFFSSSLVDNPSFPSTNLCLSSPDVKFKKIFGLQSIQITPTQFGKWVTSFGWVHQSENRTRVCVLVESIWPICASPIYTNRSNIHSKCCSNEGLAVKSMLTAKENHFILQTQ